MGSDTTSTNALTFLAGSAVKIAGTPAPGAGYTLFTTAAIISGTPVLDPPFASHQLQIDGGNTLKLVPKPGFSTWIAGTFTHGVVPPGLRGPNDDPDNDGINNLIEYALNGLDPTQHSPGAGSFTADTLSFTKRPGTSGLTYSIQESADLGVGDPWEEVAAGPSYTNNPTTISHTINPSSAAKKFLRLQVRSE